MASIKTIMFKSAAEAVRHRRAAIKGKKYLGNGAFASAYLNKCKRRVTKVGGLNDAYLFYAKQVIKANSKNPFLPKLYSLTIYKYKGSCEDDAASEEFYVVEMERLYELYSKFGDNTCQIVDAFEHTLEYGDTLESFVKRQGPQKLNIPGMFSIAVNIDRKAAQFIKHLNSIVRKAIRAHGDDECSWDIHDGNIMVRRNGQVVMTDPIA